MFRFIKIKDPTNEFEYSDIEFATATDYLPDLVEEFGRFLIASGFHFGKIRVMNKDGEEMIPSIERIFQND